jgi:WD40 repeat protein
MNGLLHVAWRATLDDYPTTLALSRDGRLIAAGTASGKLVVMDAQSGALHHTLDGHSNGILAASFGRQELATAGQDGCARLWNLQTGQAVAELSGGAGWVSHLLWTPDGKRFATAAGKTVKLWNAQGQLQHQWSTKAGINGLALNAVGGLLAASTGAEIQLWRCFDGGLDRSLSWVSTLLNTQWSPDGKVLAAGSIDRSVHFWRAGSWLDSKMGGYAKKPQVLAWSADSKWLATTGEEAVIVWNFSGKGPEGSSPLQLKHHARPPECLATHPKKPLLLSGAPDATIALWDLKNPSAPQGYAALTAAVTQLAFHPASALAFATDANGQLFAYRTDP